MTIDRQEAHDKASAHWNQKTVAATPLRIRWWQNAVVVSHINRIVCGSPLVGPHAGFHQRIKERADGRQFPKAISVACGTGTKELALVRAGIVDTFHLFELSEKRIELGQKAARAAGVDARMIFHQADAFEQRLPGNYDLVYWNNALHHMLNVEEAVAWSYARLASGGFFAMDDFVGPTRFQWSDRTLEFSTRVRQALPERLLVNPTQPDRLLSREVRRPVAEKLADIDPTEAADSGRILSVVKRRFPGAEFVPTGGAIYGVALNDVIANFTPDDQALLQAILLVDEALAAAGDNHYAVALARKEARRRFFSFAATRRGN